MPKRPPGGWAGVECRALLRARVSRIGAADVSARPLSIVMSVTARGPAHGALHRLAGLALCGGVRRAVVQRHGDIGAQLQLHIHRVLGRQPDVGAIDGRTETHALLGDLAQAFQAENLEAAGVGEDRAGPVHKTMQATMQVNDVGTGAQHQVKGVAETDVGAEAFELFRRHSLHSSVGPHRHKRRRFDHAVGKSEATEARGAIGCQELKLGSHNRSPRRAGPALAQSWSARSSSAGRASASLTLRPHS